MTAPKHTIDLGRIEIKTLMTEIQRREIQIKSLLRRRATLAKRLDALDARIVEMGGCPKTGIAARIKRPRNSFSLIEALRQILKDQPMGIPRIVPTLPTIGYRSESPNLRTMVNVALLNKKYFKRVARGVYIARPDPAIQPAKAA